MDSAQLSFVLELTKPLPPLPTMKLLSHFCATTPQKWRFARSSWRLIEPSFQFPTRTLTTSSPPNDDITLYRRLLPARNNPNKATIAEILDEWVKEGINVDRRPLLDAINQFKMSRHFALALQICQWMNGQECLGSSAAYVQVQLDLMTKVLGLKQAEQYFDSLPNDSKVWHGYIVLLNCYAKEKMLVKAEAAMQKLRELRYGKPLAYNIMLGLYSQLGMHAKLDSLVQEMAEKDIGDRVTYNIRLNIYATSSNIEQMEKVLLQMEVDSLVTMDWNSYSIAANGYLNAGAMEKAFATVQKAEHLIRVDSRNPPCDFLITLYARMGEKDHVYRIWDLHTKTRRFSNRSYVCMMSALAMLDDLDGAEKIFKEWEAGHTFFEHRVPNFLIGAYCKKGLMENANSVLNRLIMNGKKPDAGTWKHMAVGYLEVKQMDKVVETTKEAILASHSGWKPNFHTLAACLSYLEEKGDREMAEEIMTLLEKKAPLSTYNRKLIKYLREKERAHLLLAPQEEARDPNQEVQAVD